MENIHLQEIQLRRGGRTYNWRRSSSFAQGSRRNPEYLLGDGVRMHVLIFPLPEGS